MTFFQKKKEEMVHKIISKLVQLMQLFLFAVNSLLSIQSFQRRYMFYYY